MLAYPRETVVAEKLEAIVKLGMINSRMKDFYDLWVFSRSFPFDGIILTDAIAATFERRGTDLPGEVPIAFTPDFYKDELKIQQWTGFMKKSGMPYLAENLETVVLRLYDFLMPCIRAALEKSTLEMSWTGENSW